MTKTNRAILANGILVDLIDRRTGLHDRRGSRMNPDTEWLTSYLNADEEDLLKCWDPGDVAIDFARFIRECIKDDLSSFEQVSARCGWEYGDYYDDELARFIHKCVINPAFAAEVLGRLDPQG